MRKRETAGHLIMCERPGCIKLFPAKRKSAHYCSPACRQASYRERKDKAKVRCNWCDLFVDPSHINPIGYSYCSDSCEKQSQESLNYFLQKKPQRA